jgi:transcriptional regulator with XRE-family HTH domain
VDPSSIGAGIERVRREAGLTQAVLAERIGTTQAAISKIETGRTLPGFRLLDRIARGVGGTITIRFGVDTPRLSRRQRQRRVKRALADFEFDPWARRPSAAERESLLADGLTRERFRKPKPSS